MPTYRLQQTIQTADNVAANYATNNWAFIADDLTILPTIQTAVTTFYNAIRTYFGTLVRQNGHTYKWYDMADLVPRAPVLEGAWNLTSAPVQPGLPPEVSLCMSFQGERISGVPQARRRGRLYLPFMAQSNIGTDGRPLPAMITAIAAAADTFVTSSKGTGTWDWIVLSDINPTDASIVDNGWIDNEWDTQRRRGRVATTRNTFS